MPRDERQDTLSGGKSKQANKSDYLEFRAYQGCRTRKLEIGHEAGVGLVGTALQLYQFFFFFFFGFCFWWECVSLALLAAVVLHNEDTMCDVVC
jgi:hypothetical protein